MPKAKKTTHRLRARLLAVGSALDFWPARDYREFLPRGSLDSRIGGYWERTGQYLRTAIEKHEQPPLRGS